MRRYSKYPPSYINPVSKILQPLVHEVPGKWRCNESSDQHQLQKSPLESKANDTGTLAPSTFRIPISFTFLSTTKMDNPKRPNRQSTRKARQSRKKYPASFVHFHTAFRYFRQQMHIRMEFPEQMSSKSSCR